MHSGLGEPVLEEAPLGSGDLEILGPLLLLLRFFLGWKFQTHFSRNIGPPPLQGLPRSKDVGRPFGQETPCNQPCIERCAILCKPLWGTPIPRKK